ncbi:hypothetical protein COW94_02435 [Candidatus Peregrinibacteria bacterium CG22_combo_CG10-13_8_21_14_all_44_10]|nr:MAG: hypothetical protein AUK45_02150 [Candidatus Peregrinibacteria bacterium CG2_30_44_17]PIP66321.1 MAG: hypothetical protein COW94_02435 [Candidatus Peregrinibacteria bacterium CG22_combo_CG10-13_8_21_14_all_44_10]PIS04018.1 MAG: hypothetical protein COT83_02960 [Candidatus Peregrinibacteria bacterium CG10_big_fil_rev_8_21_14_0_10_44_7]PIX79236.1 MAG: hypothetical protein COZ35_03750 [Candidatus Peregrinibacteria bacterium CG_4_10_14_3_um_filter_44_21]PJB88441.1 MAG: hypothetical protein 
MTNPNSRSIVDGINRRNTLAGNLYYESVTTDGSTVLRVRDRVASVVNKILGEERPDRYDVLGKVLGAKRLKKPGFLNRMFGGLSKRIAGLFGRETADSEPHMSNLEIPDINTPDYIRITSTLRDILPPSDVMELPDDPDYPEEANLDTLAEDDPRRRHKILKEELRSLVSDAALGDPEMAFVYHDLVDDASLEDYRRAIEILGANREAAAPESPAAEGDTDESSWQPPTVFQIRSLAIARRIARENAAMLGNTPQGYEPIVRPENYRRAYIEAYFDRFGFRDDDLRRATLIHAARQLEQDSQKNEITFEEILDKTKGISKSTRSALHAHMTDAEVSDGIASKQIILDDLPQVIAVLRAALMSGRVYDRPVSLDENFGALMLKLHKMYHMYQTLDDLEGMDEQELRDPSSSYQRIIETQAERARKQIRATYRAVVGQPPIADDPEHQIAASLSGENSDNEDADGENPENNKPNHRWDSLKDKFSGLMESYRENPLMREAVQVGLDMFSYWFVSRVRRLLTRSPKRTGAESHRERRHAS